MLKPSHRIVSTLLLTLASTSCLAVSPAASEQSVMNFSARSSTSISSQSPVVKQPQSARSLTDVQKNKIQQFLNSPEFSQLILDLVNKHPDFSATAKSVLSPAAVPFQWGGIGLASDSISRYPSQRNVSYKSGLSASLPFGDSDHAVGGVLSIGTAQLQPLSPPSPLTQFGHQGSVGLALSRWLLPRTIASAGVGNLIPWGTASRLVGKSYYGALTQYMGLPLNKKRYPLSASIGIGTGAFNPYSALNGNGQPKAFNDHNGTIFANTALNLTHDMALVGDYYSHTYALGLAYNLNYGVPLNVMLYAANLKTSPLAPSRYIGLRVAMGVPFALFKRN